MHEVLNLSKQHPSQKFAQKFHWFWTTPKFIKNPKSWVKRYEMHEKEGEINIPDEEKWSWDQKLSEEEVWSAWEMFWEVKRLKGERNESEIARRLYIESS